ncbi:hypothetical protein GCM10023149_31020 [Mucilaginibacter gynuensis]|uniref:ASCH domain-containing protein n=1 Tax=Mucilaginibacter gynuensis TaxID=1302236 RepID=A0ABP8GNC5_9SPHI
MKEHPILFSTDMVLAILAGRKTMTRRTVKKQPDLRGVDEDNIKDLKPIFETWYDEDSNKTRGPEWYLKDEDSEYIQDFFAKAPFGETGDLLWLKEEHLITVNGNIIVCEYKDGSKLEKHFKQVSLNTLRNIQKRKTLGKWQRGRFLPKEFCRIWLEKTATRVERLHEISIDDIKAEGVRYPVNDRKPVFKLGHENSALSFIPDEVFENGHQNAQFTEEMLLNAHWAELWCSINGRENYDSNPWIWVIEFKVLSTTGKPA